MGDTQIALQRIRQDLLMGGKQGNHFLGKASSKSIPITELDLSTLWRTLIMNAKPVQMIVDESQVPSTKKLIMVPQSVSAATAKQVQRLARAAALGLEERGFNYLNLCVGQVSWQEEKKSGLAPLLLIPIHLSISLYRSKAHVTYSEEPIQWNPALVEKIRQQQPDLIASWMLEDQSDASAEELLARWEQLETIFEDLDWPFQSQMMMDVLNAAQLQIYRDLNPAQWSSVPPLLQKTLGAGFVVDRQRQGLYAAQIAQRLQTPESTPVIVDADPTQMLAISTAMAGGNMVIQGPPGTGKSQTIANIVAAMVSEGKKVLFVSQKKAALDVVYQRLCRANLQHMILELHSSKSKRSQVQQSLARCREQCRVHQSYAEDLVPRTSQHRQKVEKTNALLQRPVGATSLPLSILFSNLYQASPVAEAPTSTFSTALSWTPEQVGMFERAAVELTGLVRSESIPWLENPFCDIQSAATTLMQNHQVFDVMNQLKADIDALLTCLDEQVRALGCRYDTTVQGVQALLEDLEFIAGQPDLSEVNLSWIEVDGLEAVVDVLSMGQALGITQNRLLETFEPSSLYRCTTIERQLATMHQLEVKWWRSLLPSWWSTLKGLRAAFRPALNLTHQQWDAPVQELQAFHRRLVDFEERSQSGGRYFGAMWKGLNSDWADLHHRVQWIRRLPDWVAQHPNFETNQSIQRSDLAECATRFYGVISASMASIKSQIEALASLLEPLPSWSLHWNESASLEDMKAWLNHPNLHRQALARALAINQVCRPLRDNGMHEWVSWLMQGPRPQTVVQHWQYLVAHSRVQQLLAQPMLQRMTRSTLQQRREDFIALDAQLQYAAQEALVMKHVSDVQSLLCVGEMATLTSELSRRRGGRTIRQLMTEAGGAIQRLKPIMMMSPMSVATYLPQDIHFDVVIFDEASQMTLPFALGALMRADQAIVVGDSQQLSPTNFFGTGGQLESLLDRFLTKGCPSIRLSFHYRSRHPDLIAISNRFMYEGALRPFPSPNTHPLAKGVRFVSSQGSAYLSTKSGNTNPEEAAMLVREMARMMREHAAAERYPSMGVVAFSKAQRDAIEDTWDAYSATRHDLQDYCRQLPEGEHLLFKNLEDVQGDERDIILISVGYGYDSNGGFAQRFGPINMEGVGERRLNVLFSRARFELVLFANFSPNMIQGDRKSLRMLREMMSLSTTPMTQPEEKPVGFIEDVCAFVESSGYVARAHYGPRGNEVDIAVQTSDSERFVLAIMCEGGDEEISTRQRERLFPEALAHFGWPVYRVWSLPWYTNTTAEQAALLNVLQSAAPSLTTPAPFTVKRTSDTAVQSIEWLRVEVLKSSEISVELPVGAEPKTHPAELKKCLLQVLQYEGPLTEYMLLTRMCTLMPSQRTSRNRAAVKQVLSQLVHQGVAQTQHGFYFIEGQTDAVRLPAMQFQNFKDIYPPFVLEIVRFYLNGTVHQRLAIDEVVYPLIELMGFKTVTQKRKDEYRKGILSLLADTEISVQEDVMSL